MKKTTNPKANESVNPVNPVNPVESSNPVPVQELSTTTAESSAQVSKDEQVALTESTLKTLCSSLLESKGTIKAIKQDFKAMCDKYGILNAKAIIRYCQDVRKAELIAQTQNVITSFKDWDNALQSEYNRLCKIGGFEEFNKLVQNTWKDASSFVASCYPNVIDGKPAKVVSCISNEKQLFIADCYELANYDGTQATKVLLACLENIRKAKRTSIARAQDNELPTIKNERVAKAIIAVFESKADEKLFYVKGDKVTGNRKDTIIKSGLAKFKPLSEYRKERKAQEQE